ncbi:MAG: hypothetical protein JOZ55_06700 [Alphaproteobacteria bacterium]|nr:hypothetical protein [Alphaproteobacteria bacterium]
MSVDPTRGTFCVWRIEGEMHGSKEVEEETGEEKNGEAFEEARGRLFPARHDKTFEDKAQGASTQEGAEESPRYRRHGRNGTNRIIRLR